MVNTIRPTCHSDLPGPGQVEVWEACLVQRIHLRPMGVGLHPTTLLEPEEAKKTREERRRKGHRFLFLSVSMQRFYLKLL